MKERSDDTVYFDKNFDYNLNVASKRNIFERSMSANCSCPNGYQLFAKIKYDAPWIEAYWKIAKFW
jgi:hypothetical protein